MSDLMREEFEAWARKRSMDLEYRNFPGVGKLYECPRTLLALEAWQSSREFLVIELPKTSGLDRMSSEMSIQEIREDNRFNRALELAKKALTAAGVKYK